MSRYITFALTAFCCFAAQPIFAQPLLQRIEQGVRRQIDATRQNTTPAAAPATNGAEPGYLGVIADDQNEQGRGVRVMEVVAGGPAALGGLQTDDLITGVNGTPITKMDDMGRALEQLPAGAQLQFDVTRDGAARKIAVTLGARPAANQRRFQQFGRVGADAPDVGTAATTPAPARLGVRTLPVNEDTRQQYGVSVPSGAVVSAVTAGSPADGAKIPVGAVVVALDGQPVTRPEDLAALVRRAGPGREVELTFLARGQETRRRLTLAGAGPTAIPPEPGPPVLPTLPGTASPAGPEIDINPPARDGGSANRIEALEARIRQLEDRIQKLEAGK